jgi:hypothetical protein
MPLVQVVLVLIAVGVLLWLVIVSFQWRAPLNPF